MSAPLSSSPREDATLLTPPEQAAARPGLPWSRIAGLVAILSAVVLVLGWFGGVALRSAGTGLGTSFGLIPFVGWDTLFTLGVAGLIIALAMVLIPSLRRRVAGGVRGTPAGADAASAPAASRRLTMIALAVALAGGSGLLLFVFFGLGTYYGTLGRLVFLGAGTLAVLGLATAVVVGVLALVPRRMAQATSLGTRSFVVLVVAMVVPSLLLAGLGAYASVWVRAAASVLRSEQAQYSAQRLADDVDSLISVPGGQRPAARAGLTSAVVQAYAAGNNGGAWLSTMADVSSLRVLPRWAIRSLARQGYAVGAMDGGDPRGSMPDIVAWRAGPQEVRYFTSEAVSLPVDSSSIPLYRAPLGELAAIAGMGMAIVVCLGLLGAWILSRGVIRPVRRLTEASGRLAEGEAGVTVVPQGPREIRELAASFNNMNAKLTKAQETEQAFLLSVSHELKTPLTSIPGYAEGIGDGTVKPGDGAAVIGGESSRLERLVGDLLDSARMRKSAFTVRREAVDLAAVTQDVVRRYDVTARDAGLTLCLKTQPGASAVADNDRVLQVVSNLVENAIRCTPAPGAVTVTTAPGSVTVSDTGRGLTSDDLPRAFERFYLYSRYGSDRPVGTGLGLAIVKELTEAMGGAVSVASAVGVGTAFTVTLPADQPAVSTAIGAPARGPGSAPAGEPASALSPTQMPPRQRPPTSTEGAVRRREWGRRPMRVYRASGAARRRSLLLVVALVLTVSLSAAVAGGESRRSVTYDRTAAAAYADRWALGNNPAYWASPDSDCANFVSQCLAAGGLRPLDDAGREWRASGTVFPSVAWVNCTAQKLAWSLPSTDHSAYVVETSRTLPRTWAAGDVVYLGTVGVDGETWEHVIICVGKRKGRWVYDAHTTAHRREPMATWYPAHFSRILYCHIADVVTYDESG